MNHLTDFIDWLNNRVGGEGPLPDLLHDDYGQAMSDSLKRHFAEDRQKGGVRMSNLGKPATLLSLAKLGYTEIEPKGKLRLIFHMGDMYENFVEIMMQQYGIEIIDSQRELEWNGITGHLDFIIKSPVTDEPVIVEAKTMSANYSRMFSKRPDNDRGYVTQLALYSHCTDYPATWLCMNKGTAESFEVVPGEGIFQAALLKAEDVLERINKVQSLDDVLHTSGGYFRPPPPAEEKYRGKMTGRFLLPTPFKGSPFAEALYLLTDDVNGYGKPTTYVDGYADVHHMKETLDYLVDNGKVTYNGSQD